MEQKDYSGVKAFLIARVSDPSQREALPAQRYKLTDYAKRLDVDAEYHEFDESAYKEDREKFEKIVNKIYKYPQKCLVVFDKIDRFTRDCSSEIVNKLKRTTMNDKTEMHFISDNLFITKNSPACDLFRLEIGMAAASYYSSSIRDCVKRKASQKVRDGEWPGKAPIGYLNVEIGDKKEIIIDEMRRPIIEKAFELRLAGMSTRNITQEMHKLGLITNSTKPRPIPHSSLCAMFNNTFYYGIMRYDGQYYPHKYPTYISKKDYDEIKRLSENNCVQKFYKKTQRQFTFKGILKCTVCGCSMSSYIQKGNVYMRCSNAKGKCPNNATENAVLRQLEPIFGHFSLNDDLARAICDEINRDAISAKELREATKRALREEYQKLTARKDAMYEDKLDGRITAEKYDELVAKGEKRMSEIDDELVRLEQDVANTEITVSNLLKLATNANELFKSSKPAVKNQILRLSLSNLQIQQKRLQFNLLKPFSMLSDFNNCPIWLPGLDSNQ